MKCFTHAKVYILSVLHIYRYSCIYDHNHHITTLEGQYYLDILFGRVNFKNLELLGHFYQLTTCFSSYSKTYNYFYICIKNYSFVTT